MSLANDVEGYVLRDVLEVDYGGGAVGDASSQALHPKEFK